jgi:hypothetical protein
MPVAAAFDSVQALNEYTCLDNTRVELLSHITAWRSDPDSERVLWLRGLPGTGKSSIARSIAERILGNEGGLGASFFFSTNKEECCDPKKLFPTMAYHLTMNLERNRQYALAHLIRCSVINNPDIQDKPIERQWEALIRDPLSTLDRDSLPRPSLLLVIDALDECNSQVDIMEIIRLLAESKVKGLRILLTSRPQVPVTGVFKSSSNIMREVDLNDTAKFPVKDNIFRFLKAKLNNIETRASLSIKEGIEWPENPEVTLKMLAELSDPLFEFASTAYRYIVSAGSTHVAEYRLFGILNNPTEIGQDSPSRKLHSLYNRLMQDIVGDQPKGLLSTTVGPIAVLQDSLSISAIANLVGENKDIYSNRLSSFRPVLDIPTTNDIPVRIHHQTFKDFLFSAEHCGTSVGIEEFSCNI